MAISQSISDIFVASKRRPLDPMSADSHTQTRTTRIKEAQMRGIDSTARMLRSRFGVFACLAVLWVCPSCGSEEPDDQGGGAGSQDVSIISGAGGTAGAAAGVAGSQGQPVAGAGRAGATTAAGGAGRTGLAGRTASGGAVATGSAGKSSGTGGANNGGTTIGGAGGKASAGANGAAGGISGPLSNITLWIAGDSTVMTYNPATDPGLEGWGQEIKPFFGDTVTVNNQAIGGRSTTKFMYDVTCTPDGKTPIVDKNSTPPQWGRIKTGIKAGDFLLIQFGHNDAGTVCDRHVDLDDYKTNLSDMADIILAKSATPIMVTPMSTLSYKNGTFTTAFTDYSAAMKSVAKDKGLECVDLNTLSVEYYKSVGYDKLTKDIFQPGGNTHFQKEGAIAMARLITEELKAIGSPLARHLR
jgi:lysophospholipase L1-like esterase